MRRTIANRLGASKRDVPHYYLTSEIQMDRVIRLRALFNKAAEERAASSKAGGLKAPTKLSVNDFVIKASALACADVPEVNSSWQEDFVRQLSGYLHTHPSFTCSLRDRRDCVNVY
jgi:pyruvate dehydrogenase E2 component (dihydrolipoamide acetyltransferase)